MGDAASKASEWREKNRKLVTLPSGLTVLIRKLSAQFILDVGDLFEQILEAGEAAPKGAVRPAGEEKILRLDRTQQKTYLQRVMVAAVVEPKLVPDGQPAKDDELHVSDLGPDLDPLLKEIHEWSGEVLQTKSFRASKDGVAAPPAGEDLREVAVGLTQSEP